MRVLITGASSGIGRATSEKLLAEGHQVIGLARDFEKFPRSDKNFIPHSIDLSDLDRSVATNAPGQSAQPGSPFYGNLSDHLGNGEYFPLLFSREAVEGNVAHRLTLRP